MYVFCIARGSVAIVQDEQRQISYGSCRAKDTRTGALGKSSLAVHGRELQGEYFLLQGYGVVSCRIGFAVTTCRISLSHVSSSTVPWRSRNEGRGKYCMPIMLVN
jgi:hypothetical protein